MNLYTLLFLHDARRWVVELSFVISVKESLSDPCQGFWQLAGCLGGFCIWSFFWGGGGGWLGWLRGVRVEFWVQGLGFRGRWKGKASLTGLNVPFLPTCFSFRTEEFTVLCGAIGKRQQGLESFLMPFPPPQIGPLHSLGLCLCTDSY